MIHSRKSALQRYFFFIIHYCAWSAFSFLMTDSYLLGTEDTTDFWKDVLPFFSAAFLWMGFVTLLFLFKIPKSALLDSASRHTCQVLFFTFFPSLFDFGSLVFLDRYQAPILLSCQASGDCDSVCLPVFWNIRKHSCCPLSISSPQHLSLSCSPVSSHTNLRGSL